MSAGHPLRERLPTLRSLLLAPVRPRPYLRALYLFVAFPLGIVYFVVLVTGVTAAVPTVLVLVGVPLCVGVLLLARGLGLVERHLVTALLGVDVPAPAYGFLEGSVRERVVALVVDRSTWTELLYLFSMFGFGMGSFVFLVTSLAMSLTFVATPLYYDSAPGRVGIFPGKPIGLTQSLYIPWGDLLVGAEVGLTMSEWAVDSLPDAMAMSLVGFALLFVTLNLVDGIGWLWGQYARLMLSDDLRPVAWLRGHLNGVGNTTNR
ncbi:sensor domain-containing protein [Haloarcula montana]|uniref:sensor domain-containing protein n=1 Tax=Haloarcula montana TaxID=3111776 RepID=UPI002D791A38|nr:sensor domain-containing protein [Haloarcula sp. GH36]